MNKTLLSLSLLSLAACASNRTAAPIRREGGTEFRVSTGVTQTKLKATKTERFFGQDITVTEEFEGTIPSIRVEGNGKVGKNSTAGVFLDFGVGDLDDVSMEQISLGGIARSYLDTGSRLRPFAEVRAGYRATSLEGTVGHGFDVGGALGLEWDLGRKSTLHVSVGYDYSTSDVNGTDSEFTGIPLMLGGTIRF